MNCTCGKPGKVKLSYTSLIYCKSCFLRMIQHRAQKELRQRAYFKGKDRAAILADRSKEYFIARWLLESIFENRLKLKMVRSLRAVVGKKIQPTNLDRVIQQGLEPFLSGKKWKPAKTILYFPTSLLEEEIIQACRLLGYKSIQKDPVHSLIDALEQRSPGTKFALYQSFRELNLAP